MNKMTGPSFVIIDLRGILAHGILPGCAVLRREKGEALDAALERCVDKMMESTPPDDVSTALVVDHAGISDGADDDGDVPEVVLWLERRMGITDVYRVRGGVDALAESHRFLFGLPYPKPDIPSQLANHLFFGVARFARLSCYVCVCEINGGAV